MQVFIALCRVTFDGSRKKKNDKQKTGNYVAGVFSRQQTKAAHAPKQSAPSNEPPMDFDDDIPF